jgi:hypothetical protein
MNYQVGEHPPIQKKRPTGMLAFTIIWIGQVISLLGSAMTGFALTIWAWQITGQATALALVGFFAFAPSSTSYPFGWCLGGSLEPEIRDDDKRPRRHSIYDSCFSAVLERQFADMASLHDRGIFWCFWGFSVSCIFRSSDEYGFQRTVRPGQWHAFYGAIRLKYLRPCNGSNLFGHHWYCGHPSN